MSDHNKNVIKTFLLGAILATCATFVSAAWTAPGENPPGGNTPAPINSTTLNQIKQGGLKTGEGVCPGIDGVLSVCGALKVDDEGVVNEGTLVVQGTDELSLLDIGYVTDVLAEPFSSDLLIEDRGSLVTGSALSGNDSVDLDGTARIDAFAEANNPPTYVYPARVCFDETGTMELCQSIFSVDALFQFSSDAEPDNECNFDMTVEAVPSPSGQAPFLYSWSLSGVTAGNSFVSPTNSQQAVIRVERDTMPTASWSANVTVTDINGYTDTSSVSGTVTGYTSYGIEC